MGRLPRLTFGAVIGLLAGVSFGLTIYPLVLDKFVPDAPGAAYLNMARLALPASLLWVPGGVLAALSMSGRKGALYMGLASLVAGLIYGVLAAPGKVFLPMVTVSVITAGLYGAGAGFLVGAGFPPPPTEKDKGPESSQPVPNAPPDSPTEEEETP